MSEQGALFDPPSELPPQAGRHSAAIERSVKAAAEGDALLDLDAALVSVARAGMYALDCAERMPKPAYPLAQTITPVRESIEALFGTPQSRATGAEEELKQLMEEMNNATDASAEVRNTEESGA